MNKIRGFIKKKGFCNILPWVMMVVAYIITFIFIYFNGRDYIDADMSGEMVLANLLNEEGSIISHN